MCIKYSVKSDFWQYQTQIAIWSGSDRMHRVSAVQTSDPIG